MNLKGVLNHMQQTHIHKLTQNDSLFSILMMNTDNMLTGAITLQAFLGVMKMVGEYLVSSISD